MKEGTSDFVTIEKTNFQTDKSYADASGISILKDTNTYVLAYIGVTTGDTKTPLAADKTVPYVVEWLDDNGLVKEKWEFSVTIHPVAEGTV